MYFVLEDAASLQYDFQVNLGPLAKVLNENGQIELDNIEKSFTPGSVVVGEKRLTSKQITLEYKIHNETDTGYRELHNNLLYWSRKAIYLLDTDNAIRTKVTFQGWNTNHYTGGRLRGTTISLNFLQEEPFWEDTTEVSLNYSGSTINEAINNTGYLPTPATFTLTTTTTTNGFQIYITENGEGVEIQDLSFGTDPDLLIYTVNNLTGEALLSTVNRNDRIRGGTGFFNFPVGNFTLNIESDQSLTVNIKYRRRFFI